MDGIDLSTLFFAAVFTNNILLTNFLGLCPYLAISRDLRTAAGLGAAVVLVMASTAAINHLLFYQVLMPLGLQHFQYIVFIIVIAAFVQLVEMTMERYFQGLYLLLGIFLPLITVNCAILGASLFMVIRDYSLAEGVVYGAGSGLGWMLAISAVGAIRERVQRSERLPRGLAGPALTLIITGILSLAFTAFSGMVQIQ